VSPVLLSALALLVIGAAYAFYNSLNPNTAFSAVGGGNGSGGTVGGSGGSAGASRGPSSVHPEYNDAISQAASAAGIDPVLLKAIVAKESNFNPNAINPETDFVLNGVSYAQYDTRAQASLAEWIKDGNDPGLIGLNPSCGIAQVRVSNGKHYISGLDAWDLFDPQVCLAAAAYLIRDDGTTLDTADMYNVGHGTNWARGVRNAGYKADVQSYYAQFAGDF
jgi:hypothetical protein